MFLVFKNPEYRFYLCGKYCFPKLENWYKLGGARPKYTFKNRIKSLNLDFAWTESSLLNDSSLTYIGVSSSYTAINTDYNTSQHILAEAPNFHWKFKSNVYPI